MSREELEKQASRAKAFEYIIREVEEYITHRPVTHKLKTEDVITLYSFTNYIAQFAYNITYCGDKECRCNSKHYVRRMLDLDVVQEYLKFLGYWVGLGSIDWETEVDYEGERE